MVDMYNSSSHFLWNVILSPAILNSHTPEDSALGHHQFRAALFPFYLILPHSNWRTAREVLSFWWLLCWADCQCAPNQPQHSHPPFMWLSSWAQVQRPTFVPIDPYYFLTHHGIFGSQFCQWQYFPSFSASGIWTCDIYFYISIFSSFTYNSGIFIIVFLFSPKSCQHCGWT